MVIVEAIEKARGESFLGCGLEDGDGRSWEVHAGGSGASSVLQPACLVVMLKLSGAAHQRYVGEERINVAAGPSVPNINTTAFLLDFRFGPSCVPLFPVTQYGRASSLNQPHKVLKPRGFDVGRRRNLN